MDGFAAPPVIGFIGPGQLGGPALARLIDAGADVRVHGRRAELRNAYAARGVPVSAEVAVTARDVDVLVVFVFSGAQLREVLLSGALAAMTPGSTVVVHTTASVSDLEVVAAAAAEVGVRVVDAPVSGTADDIRAGQLTVLLGGEGDAVQRATSVVEIYAGTIVHVGPLGAAMRVKLINNLVFAAHVQVAVNAAQLAASMGLDSSLCLDAVMACSGASAAMGRLRDLGADPARFGELVGPYLRKDVAACLETATELGLELGSLLETVRSGPLPLS